MEKTIEVEIRGQITKEKYEWVKRLLHQKSSKEWQDNREAYFFVIPNVNLKISKYLSQSRAKIALKASHESKQSAKEIEVGIRPDDTNKALHIFRKLGFTKINKTKQIRTNYIYQGVEIAIKWSEDWGFHFEMECVVDTKDKIVEAKNKLRKLARELSLKPMGEKHIRELIQRINEKHGLQ